MPVIIPPPIDEEEQWSAPASSAPSFVPPRGGFFGDSGVPLQLTMAEYSQLTGQEQLDWWSAGGTLKV